MRRLLVIVLGLIILMGQGVLADDLLGAGATFPYPLYSKMFSEYAKLTGVRVNYQSIGSGGGQRQLKERTVDFGASDGFMSNEDLKNAPAKILHVPICLGAVVVAYNVPGIRDGLKLSGDVIDQIFRGQITRWDDTRIQTLNSSVQLPKLPIVVMHRSDGSGTTFIFTDYLSKISDIWESKVGRGTSVKWPVGLGGKGNEGVAGLVKSTPGSIGYIELIYAEQNKINYATIKNAAGRFVEANLETILAAAITDIPDDTRVSITNPTGRYGYPMSGFTWILVYQDQHYGKRTLKDAQALAGLIRWMVTDGQKFTVPLQYIPLPKSVQKKALRQIDRITYNGKSV